ncbi:MAG: tetratricopeptide repeat protein, partial [Planctomycetota bacterium]
MKSAAATAIVIIFVVGATMGLFLLAPRSRNDAKRPVPRGGNLGPEQPLPLTPETRKIIDNYLVEARKNYDAGRLDEAIRNGEKALKFLRDRGCTLEAARQLIEFARWYFQSGDLTRGSSYLLSAYVQGLDGEGESWKTVSKEALEEMRYLVFGLSEVGRDDDAIATLERFLSEFEKRGDTLSEAQMLHNMGWVLSDNGKYERAEKMYMRALALRRKSGTPYGVIWTLSNLGFLYYRMKRPDAAAPLLVEAFELAGGDHSEPWNKVLDNLLFVIQQANEQGKHGLAIELGEKAVPAVREKNTWYLLNRMLSIHADSLRLAGRYDEAIGLYGELESGAGGEGDRYAEAAYALEKGKTHGSAGRTADAEAAFEQAWNLQDKIGDHLGMAWTDDARGRLLMKRGRHHEANSAFRAALSRFEAADGYRQGLLVLLPALVESLEAIGKGEEAVEVRDRLKKLLDEKPPGDLERVYFMEQIERRDGIMQGMGLGDILIRIRRVKGGWVFTDVPTALEKNIPLSYRGRAVVFQGIDFRLEGSLVGFAGFWVFL